MILEAKDIIIFVLIVLNIAQIYLTKGHIPPELADKLFEFAAERAAQTVDPNDDKLIADLKVIFKKLLEAQTPVETQVVKVYPVPDDTGSATISDGTTTITSNVPSNTTISYTTPEGPIVTEP